MSSLPTKLQYGEIKNKATGYLDLSLVYGNEENDAREVRTNSKGKLNMNSKNLLATDANGNYSKISDRMRAVPFTAIWPSLFTRNHNKLAEELSNLNPKWSDDTIFQEARRVNIAVLQSISYNGFFDSIQKSKGGLKINENYNENMDVSINLEFHSAAYRYFHKYVNKNIKFVDNNSQVTNVALSDTFGKLHLVEDKLDDAIRGLLSQKMNFGGYTEELTNKFAKNDRGLGIDVISFDVQRGKF
jgi:peroxidase